MYRAFAFILLLSGALLIFNTALPIAQYELTTKTKFSQKKLLSPLGNQSSILGRSTSDFQFASTWFEGTPTTDSNIATAIHYYNLSIPKLKIYNATVEIAGEDLSKNLIHYKGTALPGRTGNAVIFGHSLLPQFFNPKNYLSIFSTLPTLKIGDQVTVNYDGITYRYQVIEMFEVSPKAIEVLNQDKQGNYLTLITCVPPGTYLKRLVIRTQLVPPNL